MIYLIICLIIKENKRSIIGNSKETIMLEFNEFSNSIKVDLLMNEVIKLYKFIPHSLLPINYSYHEELFHELRNTEFFKDRWWEFENFFKDNTEYNVPVITFEDVTKIYDKVLFIDIRLIQEFEYIRVKDSYFLSLNKNKYFDNTLNLIEKNNGNKFIVLINNKGANYKDKIMFLLSMKIKFVCILQGGIDVVFIDEPNLILTKK